MSETGNSEIIRTLNDLSSIVLPKRYFEDYETRKIAKMLDLDILKMAADIQHNVLVYGPTGPGKTSMVMAYAAREGLPFFSIPCNGAIEPRHFFGSMIPNGTTPSGDINWTWQDGPITRLVRMGGVILLDEVNFLHPRIGAILHSLLDKRRQITLLERSGEIVDAHPDTLVVAAYNPGYEGTRPLNAAFKNRFAIKLEFDYDRAVEKRLVEHPVLLDLAAKLRTAHQEGEISTPISTNMLMEFEDFADLATYEFAVMNFLSAFPVEERAAIKQVFDLNGQKMKEQFGKGGVIAPDVDDDLKDGAKS